jgi:crossover junction endodeoxyribonuclease RusA
MGWCQRHMLPFEFTIEGPPVSSQTRRRRRLQAWKAAVHKRAVEAWPGESPPLTQDVILKVVYYYDGEPLDTDNMLKPIQDALVGVVYTDDALVTDVYGRRRALDGSFRVRGMSATLAAAFSLGREFLHIQVLPAPDPQDLR